MITSTTKDNFAVIIHNGQLFEIHADSEKELDRKIDAFYLALSIVFPDEE